MTREPGPDPLAPLAAARARPRARVAVGAAVVVFLLTVAISAVGAFAASGGGDHGEIGPASGDPSVAADGVTVDGGAGAAAVDAPQVLVHVLGAVVEPGLVELAAGARVIDAIAAAGGLAEDADPAGVNLARTLADGEQLVVPREGEVPPPVAEGTAGAGAPGGGAPGGRVSLNRAGLAELDTLPRIGPALAQRIIDWRESNGPFTDVSQLMDVAGIGDAVYAGLVDLVSL
ncbi:helix-hairpin-helix domain-containing protein [Agromyces marinus]|uniref:Competence protein ComEA n=1 Tax=Agromyces marinus TaxID=1389020 RepID=A0ABN6YD49_9MICO|nr:helix-hairpin-helix domain-containing protein [Agromyces marinus]UIP58464.1 hypothetical protein DSM26151_13390 [Agromyces marinus]BDZ53273.1 competence protein ComEA [Agromyces marinus]